MAVLLMSELISLVEAFGVIATLFVIFFFSRKEMRNLQLTLKQKF
jgi:hypothetical protein